MTSATKFVSASSVGAHYFRPADYAGSFAVVLKPRSIVRNGAEGKPEAICSAVVFDTEASLKAGKPTRILTSAVVNVQVLYRQLARALDQDAVVAGFIGKGEMTMHNTRPWVIKDLDPATQQRIVEIWDSLAVAA